MNQMNYLSMRYVFENWEMSKDKNLYWMETHNYGNITYVKDEKTFYTNYGTDKQEKTTLKKIKELPSSEVVL